MEIDLVLEEAARRYAALQAGMKDAMTSEFYEEYPYSPNDVEAFKAGAKWKKKQIEKVLLSEVLPCFMHGGEADEVVAKLDEVLNQKK